MAYSLMEKRALRFAKFAVSRAPSNAIHKKSKEGSLSGYHADLRIHRTIRGVKVNGAVHGNFEKKDREHHVQRNK